MELLSDQDLKVYAQQLKLPLLAVLQKDMFRTIIPQVGAYIINLQSSTEKNKADGAKRVPPSEKINFSLFLVVRNKWP